MLHSIGLINNATNIGVRDLGICLGYWGNAAPKVTSIYKLIN